MSNIKSLIKYAIIAFLVLNLFFIHTIVRAQDTLDIAIVQLVSHPSLDQIRQGIIEGFAEKGYIEGENLNIDYQNSENDLNLLSTISQQVVANQPDLIFAVTTPVAQSLQNTTQDIPIILAGVTDPKASGLVEDLEIPGGNITGVSDKVNPDVQFESLQELLPGAKRVGLIYTTNESNSEIEMNLAKEIAQSMGYEVQIEGINSTMDMAMIAESLASKVDAIYVGSDNTIASAFNNLLDITDRYGVPVFTSVDSFVEQGALFANALNQKDVGLYAAYCGIDVLGGQDTATMPIQYIDDLQPLMNFDTLDRLGLSIESTVIEQFSDISTIQGDNQ